MNKFEAKIFPLGDKALTITFGNKISPNLNALVLKTASFFENNPFTGFEESVPAYGSLTIFYDIKKVRNNFPEFATAFAAIKKLAEDALNNLSDLSPNQSNLIKIPVSFAREFAPDLNVVAEKNNLTPEKVVEIFLNKTYRVYMLGFLPGFSYMGEVDERISTPRKQTPRLVVPKGSIGIAGRQTGIYSLTSPGGWQIIGKTNVQLFTPQAESPTLLQPGDSVEFYEDEI